MKHATQVVNKKNEDYDVYIGRGSKWGNPFSHLDKTKADYKVASRDEAVDRYEEWLMTQPELLDSLHELQGKTLGCFCKPERCHGDVLARLADEAAARAAETPVTSTIHIALTGHRPTKLGGYDITTPAYVAMQRDLETYIEKNLAVYQQVVGHSGLALGADTIWSKAILAMKEKYPGRVLFHAEVPMLEQSEAWFKESDITFWDEQIAKADFKTVSGSLEGLSGQRRNNEARRLLLKRNEQMVSACDVLLAVHDGSKGGTSHAVDYAKRRNILTITVHPEVYFG